MLNIIETNLQFNGNYNTRRLEEIKRTILHNSGVSVLQDIEVIHNYHKDTRGYAGIGYHFYVKKNGEIYKGRPLEWEGAHAYGSNYDSIGICAEGDYNIEDMPEVQKNAIIGLIAYLKERCKNLNVVQAHRDVCATSCPGNKFPFDEIVNSSAGNEEISEENKDANMGKIATIQAGLNNNYGYAIAVDDIYGNETRRALLKALQHELNVQFDRNLVEDGIFGNNTYNASINVRKCATGSITTLIQSMLVCHGFDIAVDGIFGSATENAIKEFQRRNGLKDDGICGKNTFKALFR